MIRYLFVRFAIYILPLLLSLIIIILLKETIDNGFPYNYMIPKSIFLIFIASSAYLITKRKHYAFSISLLSVALLTSSIWMMFNAKTILGGFGGDNSFSMVMVANFMHSNFSSDVTYKGLSSFYPFYFYYAVAKIAVLFDLSYYKALKYGAFITIYFLPIVTYLLWRNLYSRQESYIMVLSTLFIITISMLFRKSYEVISLALIIPWWIYYFNLSAKVKKEAIVGGLVGGVLFGVFYYWFFPIALASIWLILTNLKNFKHHTKYYIIFILSFLVTSSPYLFPYISDLIIYGSEPFQNRYFTINSLHFPLESISTPKDFLLFSGLVYLIFFRHKLVECYLLLLLVSSYLWIFLGHIGILVDVPLLVNKLNIFIILILSLGAGLFLNHIAKKIRHSPINPKSTISISLLILMVTPLFTEIANGYNSPEVKSAKEFKVEEAWLDREILELFKEKNILADRGRMLATSNYPIYFFTTRSSRYTHPASQLTKRLEFLKALSSSKNSKFIVWILRNNIFSSIDFVWFTDRKFNIMLDNFPKANPYNKLTIEYHTLFFKDLERVNSRKELYRVPENPELIDIDNLSREDRSIYDKFARR